MIRTYILLIKSKEAKMRTILANIGHTCANKTY